MEKLRKIVIIDDDTTTAFLHKCLLQGLKVAQEIEYITDPTQALEYICNSYTSMGKRSLPDIIFLDVEMPEMNGFQFLDKLESRGVSLVEDVFIVMHTASLLQAHKQKAEALLSEGKLRGFVQKPLKTHIIIEAMGKVKDNNHRKS